jgi:hypothetical protein
LKKLKALAKKHKSENFQCRAPQETGAQEFSGPLLENAHRESAD